MRAIFEQNNYVYLENNIGDFSQELCTTLISSTNDLPSHSSVNFVDANYFQEDLVYELYCKCQMAFRRISYKLHFKSETFQRLLCDDQQSAYVDFTDI